MKIKLTSTQQATRLSSDMHLGLPVLIKGKHGKALVFSIETIDENIINIIDHEKSTGEFQPYIAISIKRATILKARVYNENAVNLELPELMSFQWLKATADPSFDLEYPLKGPYNSLRNSKFHDISEACLVLCKNSQLLPACLVFPLNKKNSSSHKKKRLLSHSAKKITKQRFTPPLHLVSSARIPLTSDLNAHVHIFRSSSSTVEHYAVEIGYLKKSKAVLTRLHSACFTGDLLHSRKCDCGEQLQTTLKMIKKEKSGILLYLNQEGRGIGLANKMRAYNLQDQGYDTFEANQRLGFEDDERDLSIGAEILKSLGVKSICLMTNNPAKINQMKNAGIIIADRIPLLTKRTEENQGYLDTKAEKSGHILKTPKL